MVTQYPDTIVITINSAATQDADGDWVTGTSTTHTFSCRAEMNTKGLKIAMADGTLHEYGFVCYMPPSGIVLSTDDAYVLTKADGSVYSGSIKNPSNGQLNTRLWL